MKKSTFVNLIKYHYEKKEKAFDDEVIMAIRDFYQSGDVQIAQYLSNLARNVESYSPQHSDSYSDFFKAIPYEQKDLFLPDPIVSDLKGAVNAVKRNIGLNKFLFFGNPGTGKTKAASEIARILNRSLLLVDVNKLIDYKLGETQKNVAALFDEISNMSGLNNKVFFFDEIDSIALDRVNSHDLREMGRTTSTFLKCLDELPNEVVVIAATNLYDELDTALVRRFDVQIDFDRYSKEDLVSIGLSFVDHYSSKYGGVRKNTKFTETILNAAKTLPMPGVLENLIKKAIAFSNPEEEYDYLKRLFISLVHPDGWTLSNYKEAGFSVRQIEALTGVSKSKIGREVGMLDE